MLYYDSKRWPIWRINILRNILCKLFARTRGIINLQRCWLDTGYALTATNYIKHLSLCERYVELYRAVTIGYSGVAGYDVYKDILGAQRNQNTVLIEQSSLWLLCKRKPRRRMKAILLILAVCVLAACAQCPHSSKLSKSSSVSYFI